MNPPVTNLKKIIRAVISNDFPHLVEHEKDIIKINEKVFATIAWVVYQNGKVLVKNFATFFQLARTKRKRYDSGLKAVVETEPTDKMGCIPSNNIFDNPDFEKERETYESPIDKRENITSATKEEIKSEFTNGRSKSVVETEPIDKIGCIPSNNIFDNPDFENECETYESPIDKRENITPETRVLIHTLFASGINKAEIARLTDVSPMSVAYIISPERLLRDRGRATKNEHTAQLNRERVRRCTEKKQKGYE